MNIEINGKQYSASVDVKGDDIYPEYVIVTVAGVEFDVKEFMPPEVWDALYAEVQRRYEEQGGLEEDLRAKREAMRLMED